MSVTAKLLKLYRVDQQLQGLESRLRAAQRFLTEQQDQLSSLSKKHELLRAQLRQVEVLTKDHEGEIARLDERIAHLREQMNTAQTNREYKAFLTEVNTFKVERDRLEDEGLELLNKSAAIRAQIDALEADATSREKVKSVAVQDRDAKADEIKDRVQELKLERQTLAREVPGEALTRYEELLRDRADEAMAPVEEHDRRRHEFTCGSCMMSLPIEPVSRLLSGGLSACPTCGCILYLPEELHEALTPSPKR